MGESFGLVEPPSLGQRSGEVGQRLCLLLGVRHRRPGREHLGWRPVHPASEHTGGYGIDGDHDGIVNVYDPGDAIPSAAVFLKTHGAPADIQAALFAWNHCSSYVTGVLDQAARYAADGTQVLTT